MAAAVGQAAGLAVGAAVGAVVGQPLAGAAIGSSAVGFLEEREAGKIQSTLNNATLRLNQEQARLKASEQSSIHARNFRKALASNVALASMRGGSGSVVSQFAQEDYRNFLQDQKAIEMGLKISEVQGSIGRANTSAEDYTRDIRALSRFGSTAFDSVNLNLLKERKDG